MYLLFAHRQIDLGFSLFQPTSFPIFYGPKPIACAISILFPVHVWLELLQWQALASICPTISVLRALMSWLLFSKRIARQDQRSFQHSRLQDYFSNASIKSIGSHGWSGPASIPTTPTTPTISPSRRPPFLH